MDVQASSVEHQNENADSQQKPWRNECMMCRTDQTSLQTCGENLASTWFALAHVQDAQE